MFGPQRFMLVALSATVLGGCPMQPAGDDTGRDIPSVKLIAPLRLSPRDNEQQVNERLAQLSWTAVAGAETYEVYLGPDLNPPLVAITDVPVLLVRDLSACTEQHWRVVARNADFAVSSPTWKFKTRCPSGK